MERADSPLSFCVERADPPPDSEFQRIFDDFAQDLLAGEDELQSKDAAADCDTCDYASTPAPASPLADDSHASYEQLPYWAATAGIPLPARCCVEEEPVSQDTASPIDSIGIPGYTYTPKYYHSMEDETQATSDRPPVPAPSPQSSPYWGASPGCVSSAMAAYAATKYPFAREAHVEVGRALPWQLGQAKHEPLHAPAEKCISV
jgi:hypothetical protein